MSEACTLAALASRSRLAPLEPAVPPRSHRTGLRVCGVCGMGAEPVHAAWRRQSFGIAPPEACGGTSSRTPVGALRSASRRSSAT
eukprot:scaffold126473_cov32-Tisochrysis_lutea.AAC.3